VPGDVLLIGSLFVFGGEFWDKQRSLFFHGARAEFPGMGTLHYSGGIDPVLRR
jgi:hypothetical protein